MYLDVYLNNNVYDNMSNYSEVARHAGVYASVCTGAARACVRACVKETTSGVGIAGRHVFAVAVALDKSFIIAGNLDATLMIFYLYSNFFIRNNTKNFSKEILFFSSIVEVKLRRKKKKK